MSAIICESSALEYLRANPCPNQWRRSGSVAEIGKTSEAKRWLKEVDLASLGIRQRPLHIAIPANTCYSSDPHIQSHSVRAESIVPELMISVSENVSVCGPLVTFATMTRRLSDIGAAVLGCELCGGYSHFAPLVSGFYKRPQLTSVDEITSMLPLMTWTGNEARILKCLNLVLEGSASPMETVLALMLSLPTRMGGFGYERPVLNQRVRLDESAKRLAGTRYCKVDLGWPSKKIAFEYDSDLTHDDLVKDRRRREALLHMGWSVYTLDLASMKSLDALQLVAALPAERLRGKGRAASGEKMRSLHARLLKATRYGLGVDNAFFAQGVHVERSDVFV